MVDAGPRSTSMRSIAAAGGRKLACGSKPFLMNPSSTFWRLPSIKISVYFESKPRRRIVWPPIFVCWMSTPGTSSIASAMSETGFDWRSEAVMMETLAGASRVSCA